MDLEWKLLMQVLLEMRLLRMLSGMYIEVLKMGQQ